MLMHWNRMWCNIGRLSFWSTSLCSANHARGSISLGIPNSDMSLPDAVPSLVGHTPNRERKWVWWLRVQRLVLVKCNECMLLRNQKLLNPRAQRNYGRTKCQGQGTSRSHLDVQKFQEGYMYVWKLYFRETERLSVHESHVRELKTTIKSRHVDASTITYLCQHWRRHCHPWPSS